jgi:hypothetical protein
MSALTISDLSVQLLESDAAAYLDTLNYLAREGTACTKEELKKKLNETPYETWYSNHAFALSRLVGKMNERALYPENGYSEGSYYGSSMPLGISVDFAISLFDILLECGGDITSKDYYEQDVVEYFDNQENTRFYRTDNEKFVEHVRREYAKLSSID